MSCRGSSAPWAFLFAACFVQRQQQKLMSLLTIPTSPELPQPLKFETNLLAFAEEG